MPGSRKQKNNKENDVNQNFHSHRSEIFRCKLFWIIVACPDKVSMHYDRNGENEKGHNGEKGKIGFRDYKSEYPVTGCRENKGKQKKANNIFSNGFLHGLFIKPYKVFYGEINGSEHGKQGQYQGKYREFPFHNLIQLDPPENPGKNDGNHLESQSGVTSSAI
jgi:hypothetical protein